MSQPQDLGALSDSREPSPASGLGPSGFDPARDEVQITAADFNGVSFDDSPFSAMPDWLREAIVEERVIPDTPNCTDYAEWWVRSACGRVLATPGDWISHYNGILTVIPAGSVAASAMSAGTGETAGLAPQAASAVPQADAQHQSAKATGASA